MAQPSATLFLEQEFCLCPDGPVELQIQLIAWKVKALMVLFSEALPVSLGLTVR